jgi:hypothetical protein
VTQMECCIRVLMNLPRQSASALIAPKIAPLTLSDRIGFATSILEAAVVRDFKKMRDAAATNGTVCRKRDSSEKRLSYTSPEIWTYRCKQKKLSAGIPSSIDLISVA